jgi:signal peptidase I
MSLIQRIMMLHKRWSTSLFSAMWLVFAVAAWAIFAPIPVGGSVAYIIVNGISMEPNFHLGDLVIVRPSSYYNVGDIVVYQNQGLGGKNVFHRIIELNLDRYILKGDNNSWVDTYQPTEDEVIGKLWIYIPRGGWLLGKVRTPLGMALTASGLGIFLVISFSPNRRKGKNQMNRNSVRKWVASMSEKITSFFRRRFQANPNPHKQPDRQSADLGYSSESLFFALGFIAFSSLILAIVSFSRPAFRTTLDNVSYKHLGAFSYSGTAPLGVYDSNAIKSGDPIFPKLTCKVDISFQYVLIANDIKNVVGTYQLTAIIADPNSGWKRSIPLQAVTPFSESSATASAVLDLCEVQSLVQSFEENSAVSTASYEVTVSPQISISANIEGRDLQDTFNTGLPFKFDHSQFYILSDTESNPFNPTKDGALGVERKEADSLSLFGLKMQIPVLRIFSLLGLAASITGMVLFGQKLQRLSENNKAEFIRMKFGAILVDVQKTKLGSSKSLVDVPSIEDLVKLAERHNTMILHEAQGYSHFYYVQVENSTYRFLLSMEDLGLTDTPVSIQEKEQ